MVFLLEKVPEFNFSSILTVSQQNRQVIKLQQLMVTLYKYKKAQTYRWPCRLWLLDQLGNPPHTHTCSCPSD